MDDTYSSSIGDWKWIMDATKFVPDRCAGSDHLKHTLITCSDD